MYEKERLRIYKRNLRWSDMARMRESGMTLKAIADHYGLSGSRVRQCLISANGYRRYEYRTAKRVGFSRQMAFIASRRRPTSPVGKGLKTCLKK